MGLWSYAVAGAGFLIIGAIETSSISSLSPPPSSPQSPPTKPPPSAEEETLKKPPPPPPSPAAALSASLLSLLFIFNSVVSIISSSIDSIAFALQLEVISVSSLFLFYSILRFFFIRHRSPSPIVTLIGLFAFAEEFLLFYLQRKDPSGVENRYFDLLLLPIAVCFFSCLLDLRSEISYASILVRGVGLISQGAWFIQMGVSFFTRFVSHGCYLQEKSRGDYTLRCKDHSDYHRGRAIATLQFNCHLALLVATTVCLYSVIRRRDCVRGEMMEYVPIFAEMQEMEGETLFTLDFEEENEDSIRDGHTDKVKETTVVSNSEVNGGGFHK